MDWSLISKQVGISVALIAGSISTVYMAHADAPVMAYVASSCASVSAYLLGYFQASPTAR